MTKNHGERIATVESEIISLKKDVSSLERESITHGDSLHDHGKKIASVIVTVDVINDAMKITKETMQAIPSTVKSIVNEVTAPLIDTVNLVKQAEERRSRKELKHKYWFMGASAVITFIIGGGVWAVMTVDDLIKALKGL